jgi:hypothetical protein
MAAMIPPGVGDGQGLEDSADRLSELRADEEVEVVGHEAIAEEAEGIALPGLGEGLQEGDPIVIVAEDDGPVVAAIEGVIDEAVID